MTGSAPLRLAVVGCGHLGSIHARLARQIENVQLTVVHDRDLARATALGESIGAAPTSDLARVIDAADAVVVASPTSTHAEIGLELLAAGRHVLVEKPITTTVEEGRALVARAERGSRVLLTGHVERWNPAFRAARRLFGQPRFLEGHRLAPFVPRSLDVDVVLDLMIHDLDLSLLLVGAPVEAVEAVGVPVLTEAEDIANARLRFRGGAVANLTASRVSRERVRKLRGFSARRYVSVDFADAKVEEVALESIQDAAAVEQMEIGTASDPRSEEEGETAALVAALASRGLRLVQRPVPVEPGNALLEELRDFVAQCQGRSGVGASGRDGVACLEVALEVRAKVRASLVSLRAGTAS